MPGACGAPVVQARVVKATGAVSALWLAVSFQDDVASMRLGSVGASSLSVQGALRPAVAARTRATSAEVTKPPALPNAVRT